MIKSHALRAILPTLIAALTLAAPASAGTGDDAMSAMLTNCIAPLESGAALGEGLDRASPEMEARLLDNKAGKILRTTNPGIVIVAHDSGETCEIMALGATISEFDTALRAWLDGQSDYRIDVEAKLGDDTPGGAYIARAIEGGFVQAFIQTHPESAFVGVTVSRVESSSAAEELLAE